MRLDALQDERRREGFANRGVETEVQEGFVNLICDPGIALLALLQQFEHDVLLDDGVFEHIRCTGLLDLGRAYQKVQELQGDAEDLDDFLPACEAHSGNASFCEVLRRNRLLISLHMHVKLLFSLLVDNLESEFLVLPINGSECKSYLFAEYKLNCWIGLDIWLHFDVCFIHFDEPFMECLLVIGVVSVRAFLVCFFVFTLGLLVVQVIDLAGVGSNSLKGSLIIRIIIVCRNNRLAVLLLTFLRKIQERLFSTLSACFLQSLLFQVLQIFKQGLERIEVAGNEDFDHVLEGSATEIRQIRVGLGLRQEFDDDLWLVGEDSQMQTRVPLDFGLEIRIGSMLNEVKHDLIVAKHTADLQWSHAILVCIHEELLLK